MSCACFGPWHSPFSNYLCCTPDIAPVGIIFNVFSYEAVLSRDDALRVEPRSPTSITVLLAALTENSL